MKFQIQCPKTYRSLRDILIVADNDEDPNGRFREVCDHIVRIFGQGVGPTAPQQKTKTTPAVTVLMIPWTNERGHLEQLCCKSAKNAAKGVGSIVDNFFALLGSGAWNQSRYGKAWLRVNLAVRCVQDPFIHLGTVFDEPRYHSLIPVDHSSFDRIANFLATFA